jgi:hypothetical protein
MAKLICRGWRTDLSDVPTPTGPVVKRNGSVVITLTIDLERPLQTRRANR